ncbi:MAG: hypothetical protein ACJ79S_12350 [Gemmatimonadaceae bacterium]
MQEQLRARLALLKRELEVGQVELEKVEQRRTYLRETMMRIGGAIQLLKELLSERPAERDGTAGELPPPTARTNGANV